METKKEYEELYFISGVCPHCNHRDIIEIYNGSDGFFTSKRFSHYKCCKCNREFKTKESIVVVARDPVQEIIQMGLDRKITAQKMIKELRKYSIRCHDR